VDVSKDDLHILGDVEANRCSIHFCIRYLYIKFLAFVNILWNFTVKLFCENHRKKPEKVIYHVDKTNTVFKKTYNAIQDKLKVLAGRDELLCGTMISSFSCTCMCYTEQYNNKWL